MLKFGPSGNSQAFYDAGLKSSEQSAVWVKNMGLDCFEYSFGRGISISNEKAVEIGKAFAEQGISISVHAPYYINLANESDEMAEKSFGYILESAKKVLLMGGNRVIFHPASMGKQTRENAVKLTQKRFDILTEKIYSQGLENVIFCPETMGKHAQIGTIEEVASFCKTDKIYVPCIDFGHVNARECGSLKTEADYLSRLEYLKSELPREQIQNFHIHFSKIEYSTKGEVKHLTFEDQVFGPAFEPLAKALKKTGLTPVIICESQGTQDIDAKWMKEVYQSSI